MTSFRLEWGKSTIMDLSINKIYKRENLQGASYYEMQHQNIHSTIYMSFYPQSGQLIMFAPGSKPPKEPSTGIINEMVLPDSAAKELENRIIESSLPIKDLR